MPRAPKILLVGHSHVNCVQLALNTQPELDNIRVLNLRKHRSDTDVVAALARYQSFAPDAVCLCLGGNFHNVLGLLEHPVPFSTSTPQGVTPGPGARHLVPRAQLVAMFEQKYPDHLIPLIFNMFPKVARFVLNAPPPIGDFSHIAANPGIFADKLHLGPAPDGLRLELHAIQSELTAQLARDHSAGFLALNLVDEHGFLPAGYVNDDPTHGNARYGEAVLTLLTQEIGGVYEPSL